MQSSGLSSKLVRYTHFEQNHGSLRADKKWPSVKKVLKFFSFKHYKPVKKLMSKILFLTINFNNEIVSIDPLSVSFILYIVNWNKKPHKIYKNLWKLIQFKNPLHFKWSFSFLVNFNGFHKLLFVIISFMLLISMNWLFCYLKFFYVPYYK